MLPKSYFEDSLAKGVAFGALQHIINNRFTLLKLPVGYGKTIISMLVAKTFAGLQGGHLQLMIIAPKAKRLDRSFNEAVSSLEYYYQIKLTILPINGQEVGTFAGLNAMKKKPKMWQAFCQSLYRQPTLLVLDETHMELRNATQNASKTFVRLFKDIEKHHSSLKILGLTATPFDTNIIDTVGYLVLNGEYSSRTNFYRREVKGYQQAYQKGLYQRDIENMIVDRQYQIHTEMFYDYPAIIQRVKKFIYAPEAPCTFHIPGNKMMLVKVDLSADGVKKLHMVQRKEREGAYSDYGTKKSDYTEVLTTDANMLSMVLRIIRAPQHHQPLIFYQLNITRNALIKALTDAHQPFLEINGHEQSFFKQNDHQSPILVQYHSGAAAFESKDSNTSIYLDLPTSAIDYQQSLGRNTRRGQNFAQVTNYILAPCVEGQKVQWFQNNYNRIVNKTLSNEAFEKIFKTAWGTFDENSQQLRTIN